MQVATFPQRIRPREKALFHEEQPYRSASFLILGIASVAFLALVIWQALIHPPVKAVISNQSAVAWTAILWLLFARAGTGTLVTEVFPDELSLSARGYWRSCRIPLSSIRSAHPVTFDAERDFGGYGIRATRCGKAYAVKGDRGVRLELTDGSAILVGSRHAEQLARVICAQIQ